MSASPGEPLGSAAQEAARLAETLQAWLADELTARGTAAARDAERTDDQRKDHQRPAEPDGPQHERHGHERHGHERHGHERHGHERHGHEQQQGPTCRVCPLCRLIALAQQSHPEVVDHLARAADHLAAAMRELVPDAGERHPPATDPDVGPPTRSTPPRRTSVRIDVEPDLEPHQHHDEGSD